jgi:hypothetical protein
METIHASYWKISLRAATTEMSGERTGSLSISAGKRHFH